MFRCLTFFSWIKQYSTSKVYHCRSHWLGKQGRVEVKIVLQTSCSHIINFSIFMVLLPVLEVFPPHHENRANWTQNPWDYMCVMQKDYLLFMFGANAFFIWKEGNLPMCRFRYHMTVNIKKGKSSLKKVRGSYSGGSSLSLICCVQMLEQPLSCSHRMQCLLFLFCPVLSQWTKQQVGITGPEMVFCVVCWQERQVRVPLFLLGSSVLWAVSSVVSYTVPWREDCVIKYQK